MAGHGRATFRMASVFRTLFTTGFTWGALGLHFLVCACYLRRWDKVAAITVFPFWSWALAGAGMAGVAWLIGRKRLPGAVFLLWVGTVLLGSDETRPLLRLTAEKPQPGVPAQVNGTRPLRIVTLNCRVGRAHPEALKDVEPWQPDIVFLQESPFPNELEKLTDRLFGVKQGEWVGGPECSILARGRIHEPVTGWQPTSVLGTVEFAPGKFIEVACVHLKGAETTVKLWKKEAWLSHYYNRQSRRAELSRLLGVRQFLSRQHPAIIGGDFNAPAGDAVFDLLRDAGFRDAFAEAGSGWPDTYPNTAPMLRIDHLWVNAGITPVRAAAVTTVYSDHRMVVCDFLLP